MPPKKRPQGSSSRQNGTSGDTNTEFAKRFVELAAKNGVAELAKMLETPHVNQEILNKAFMAASEMGHSKVRRGLDGPCGVYVLDVLGRVGCRSAGVVSPLSRRAGESRVQQ